MHELITMITEKAGISTEQAHKALDTVKEFVKDKFPMMAGAVDNLFPAPDSTSAAPATPAAATTTEKDSGGFMDKISDFIPGEMGEKIESFAKDKLGGIV